MLEKIETALKTLRSAKPLILNLSNYVTMDFMANSLLSLGAAPIMSVCHKEIEELVEMSQAININIGTFDEAFIERCNLASVIACQHKKPIILDPVGAGSSRIRSHTANQLLRYASIVRGNASEIMALAQEGNKTLGVESMHTTHEAKEAALTIAKQYGCTVIVSGPVDFITDGIKETEAPYGAHLMSLVTGMGCVLTSVVAAFRAIVDDNFESSVLATHYFGLCGALAAKHACHPGSFRINFIDILHQTDFKEFKRVYVK